MLRKKRAPEPGHSYGAPWRDFGDRSVPGRTLMPLYTADSLNKWHGWQHRPDLDGWQGVPYWIECTNGQTVAYPVHDARLGLETR